MTTIAYHHESKTIAVDSRTTCGNVIASDQSVKAKKVNGLIFIMAGMVHDEKIFIDEYINRTGKVTPVDLTAYVIDNGALYRAGMNDVELWCSEVEFSRAEGSGAAYALTAMDMGADAEDAVRMAMKRDVFTGGKVHVYKVQK